MKQKFVISTKTAKRNCIDAVMGIMQEDQMEVVIQKHKKRKTDDQRAGWHYLLSVFGDELGYTLPEMKAVVKKAVTGSEMVAVERVEVEVVPRREKADRELYSQYIETTYRLAAEIGVVLPDLRRFE